MKTLFAAKAIVAMSMLSSPLWAWPDDVTARRDLYRDVLTVKMANGLHAKATLVIKVVATLTVQENGNANFPDDRNCHFVNVRRTLIRELSLTTADGTIIPVRDTIVELPAGTGKDWEKVTPCNDVVGGAEAHLISQMGSASTWQDYIDGQRANAAKIISQFGALVPS